MSRRYWWVTKTVTPPMIECRIRTDVVLLFRSGSFPKSITCISASNNMVLEHCLGVENPCCVLIYAQGIGMVQSISLPRPRQSITCAACFPIVGPVSFIVVRPDQVENPMICWWRARFPKQILSAVLVQLQPFCLLPFLPVAGVEQVLAMKLFSVLACFLHPMRH